MNWHFNLKKFRASEVNRVKISLACVFAFMAVGWPLIVYKVGILGWVKFWLMPCLDLAQLGGVGCPVQGSADEG